MLVSSISAFPLINNFPLPVLYASLIPSVPIIVPPVGKSGPFIWPVINSSIVDISDKTILLASNEINKYEALYFTVGKSEIWGLQYHPEIPYDYMIKLIKHRSKKMIERNIFKDQNEINTHVNLIEKAKLNLSDDLRTLELKNWLNYLKK